MYIYIIPTQAEVYMAIYQGSCMAAAATTKKRGNKKDITHKKPLNERI